MTMTSRHPPTGLYCGDVVHHRFIPEKHKLKYRIFSLFVDLDYLDDLDRKSFLLSLDKFNFISFYQKDYGQQSHTSSEELKDYILKEIKTQLADIEISRIFLMTMPRVFGYVFNPLSIYFCYDASETLRVILYEVSNTFGQRHNYIFEITGSQSGMFIHECAKTFYVSPFLEMDLKYRFTITNPAETFSLAIQATKNSDVIMNASQRMMFSELKTINLARALVSMPFMTLKVITGIHIEAMRLWFKGINVVPNTPPVDKSAQFIRDQGH